MRYENRCLTQTADFSSLGKGRQWVNTSTYTVTFSRPPAGVQHSALPGRPFTVKYKLVPKKLLSSMFAESFRAQGKPEPNMYWSLLKLLTPCEPAWDLQVGCFCLFLSQGWRLGERAFAVRGPGLVDVLPSWIQFSSLLGEKVDLASQKLYGRLNEELLVSCELFGLPYKVSGPTRDFISVEGREQSTI